MNVAARFVRALGYFTIVPVRTSDAGPPEPDDVALLPLVGALVGVTAGTLAYAASTLVPRRVAAALAYALPIVLTGALHLDGFLDTCDAALASVSLERRREILRDPGHGSYAFAGGSIATIASYAALCEIEPRAWPAALAVSHSTARLAALIAAARARTNESGTASSAFARRPDARVLAAQAIAILVLANASGGGRRILFVIAASAGAQPAATILAKRFEGRLGGDAYGFLITCTDLALLTLFAADIERSKMI